MARAGERTFERTVASGGRITLDMALQAGAGNPIGWIDWVEMIYPRRLEAHQGTLRFHTPGGESGRFEFMLTSFAGEPQVWDVTDLGSMRRLGVRADGDAWLVQVEVTDGTRPRELMAFASTSARVPAMGDPVENQNLHGLAGFPEYVIVTPAVFRESAEDLADYRRAQDGLEVAVVDIDEVFNEFSGGRVDMRAVRDFLKFLYDRENAAEPSLRYTLLFGDGHYDFRGILPGGDENNWIPTYQSFESLTVLRSYTSDDYFGLLGDEEGVWRYEGDGTPSAERVDLGIGRLPARTAREAALFIEKIKHYESSTSLGAWRTRFTFVADDDHPGDDGSLHVDNAEVAVASAQGTDKDINIEKVYTPAYPALVTAVGRRLPDAAEDILRIVEEGTLVWNYSGHGGPEGLADERIFTVEDIEPLDNYDRLPIFVTATCSFGRFDMVDKQSGAELMVLAEQKGAVALFTTVRLVLTSGGDSAFNVGLNRVLTREMLTREEDGRPRRLGDIMFFTKNDDIGSQGNNRKFNLLGDPAMRIGLPNRPLAITEINGTPIVEPEGAQPEGVQAPEGASTMRAVQLAGGAELRANELTEIRGTVLDANDQPDPGFSGEVELTVFDAAREVTLDTDFYGSPSNPYDYSLRTDRIYRGRATVRNGDFSVRFIVPRDISYAGLPGRISAYVRSDTGLDGAGTTEAVTISETAGPPLDDAVGPELTAFIGDSTFIDGGLVSPNAVLVVQLRDESGINTVGAGVGHDLLVTFDDDPSSAVEVGRFYQGALDSYQSGTLRYPLPEQEPGPHTLRVTAWDVANNASTATLQYTLSEAEGLTLRNVFNYPNPTPGQTRFLFEHNQAPGTLAEVQLRIYTLSGRPVRTMEREEVLGGGPVQLPFDGLDEDADPIASGIYLYRLRVAVDTPDGTRAVAEQIERLAVIR